MLILNENIQKYYFHYNITLLTKSHMNTLEIQNIQYY